MVSPTCTDRLRWGGQPEPIRRSPVAWSLLAQTLSSDWGVRSSARSKKECPRMRALLLWLGEGQPESTCRSPVAASSRPPELNGRSPVVENIAPNEEESAYVLRSRARGNRSRLVALRLSRTSPRMKERRHTSCEGQPEPIRRSPVAWSLLAQTLSSDWGFDPALDQRRNAL